MNIIVYNIYQYFNIFVTFKADEIAAVPEIVAGDTRLTIRPVAVRRYFRFMESCAE